MSIQERGDGEGFQLGEEKRDGEVDADGSRNSLPAPSASLW